MKGTRISVTLAMRVMPPMTTRAASRATTMPMAHRGMPKELLTPVARELAWTLAPMPKEAIKPKSANRTASHLRPRPRVM